jgi:hypothetical protein
MTSSLRGSTPMEGSPNARPPSTCCSSGVSGIRLSGMWWLSKPGAPAGAAGCGWSARSISWRVATACEARVAELLPSWLEAVMV